MLLMLLTLYLYRLPPILLLISALFLVARYLLHRTALIHGVRKWVRWLDDRIHVHQHLKVPQLNHYGQPNAFYLQLSLYLNSLPSLEDSDFPNLLSGHKPRDILLHLDPHHHAHVIHDTFLGASLSWTNHVLLLQHQHPHDDHHPQISRSFVLKIKKKDKRRILRPYLQHIHDVSDDIQLRTKDIKLFLLTTTTAVARWTSSAPFSHPSTFDTLVMDPDLKTKIKSDLDTFLKSENYYHRLGRVWKRSYLLYGPSGTGKSSFVASMANYLSFDLYYLDLSRVADDSHLNMLLLQTTRKSIILIEHLDLFFFNDCSRKPPGLSLPGLLNFMDGIVNSSCADEKIMVYTLMTDSSNKEQQLESAAQLLRLRLRPGRIDVHIHFPSCDFTSFKSLANNYLGLKDHKLFPQVQEMFDGGATMSPAEVGELMLLHRSSPTRALKSVITALQSYAAATDIRRESTSSPLATLSTGSDHPASAGGGGTWKETAPAKEIRKLYGLLRLKSSKKSGPLDHQDSPFIQR